LKGAEERKCKLEYTYASLINHAGRDEKIYYTLGKSPIGLFESAAPRVWEGTEMSRDWGGGLKRVWRVGNKI